MISSYLTFSVILIVLSEVHLAPVDDKNSLFEIINSDSRADLLKTKKFVKNECKTSEEICLALYDISLKFNELKLNFTQSNILMDKEICSKLIEVLPNKSTIDSITLDKIQKKTTKNITWIKDTFKSNEDKCQNVCKFTSIEDDYEEKIKPVCLFIYNQYQFLASQSTTSNEKTNASKSGEVMKSSEHNGKSQINSEDVKSDTNSVSPVETVQQVSSEIGAAFVPILPANSVAEVQKTQNDTPQVPPVEQEQPKSVVEKSSEASKAVVKDEKTVTQVVTVIANKSETAQAKAETPKTESTVQSIDLEQESLDDKDMDIFETQSDLPEKEIENGMDIDGDEEDDYSPDLNIRDNNRNVQNNKFNNLALAEIEPHDSDQSRVHVEKVIGEFEDNPDSNFFTYLCIVMFLSILFYILYHNRHKLLALVLEGRRGSRRPRERSRGGSKAAYSKLDCNLEEAITSKKSLSGKSMDIIY